MESKKITVKHYLNKRAKTRIYKNEEFYPLYVQLIVKGQKAQVKSKINEALKIYRSDIDRITHSDENLNNLFSAGFFSDQQLQNIKQSELFPFFHLINDEIKVINQIILLKHPFEVKNFSLSTFSTDYEENIAEISNIIDDRIKANYRKELKGIFLKALDQEDNKEVFKISNYLMHYINWENSFVNFYQVTTEIMPEEIRLIDNLLSNELRISIKAFISFHESINILQRFFEKREMGKLCTLSYLDWQTSVKENVLQKFEKLFGAQKALIYVLSLENILNNPVHP